jgi:type II secretory pathway component PulF
MQKGNPVAVVEPAHPERTARSGGPPRWARLLVYGFTWLPVFAMVIGFVPRFDPVFQKLNEKGELPQLTGWLLAITHLDAACFHLPVVLVAVALLAVDEAVVRLLRRREDGNTWSWRWVVWVGLAGIVAVFIIVLGLLLPVFKFASTVG